MPTIELDNYFIQDFQIKRKRKQNKFMEDGKLQSPQ